MNLLKNNLTILICMICCGLANGQVPASSSVQRQKEKMAIMMAKPKYPVKTIGIFLYDGYQTLDAMGPYETLNNLPGVKLFFIAKKKGAVKNQHGMKVAVDTAISDVKKLDILVIPGGAGETFMQTLDTDVLSWIKEIDKTTVYTTSVCTGAWILGATGLLNGRNATTNWYRAEEMLKKYGASFKNERWVNDGKYWTAAGVTAGIDMSLAIINELMGEKYTQATMLNLEYNPHPPVTGGTPGNSDPAVSELMLDMYDAGMQPLFKKQELKRDTVAPAQKVKPVVSKQIPGTVAIVSNELQKDGTDPVCHMKVYKGSTITTIHNNKQYGFCSEGCKKRFIQSPAAFVQ